jgi:hypothetical protein
MVASILISLTFVSLGLSASTAYGLEIHMNSGVYEVPTQNPALKPFATLRLKEASIAFLDEEKNSAEVTYALPLELTGRLTLVELNGRKPRVQESSPSKVQKQNLRVLARGQTFSVTSPLGWTG